MGKLIVHPDHRNQGYGSRMMAAIEEEFGVDVYELTTAHLEKSIKLYERLGYRIIEREKLDDYFILIHMRKEK